MTDAIPETPIEPVSVLPSGKPADEAITIPSSSSSEKKNKGPAIGSLIASSPAKVDAFLSQLFRCMQTRSGADAVLMFLCYSTRLTASVLEILSRVGLKVSSRQLVAMLFKLPPATTVVMSSATTPPAVALAMDIAARLKTYSAMISEMRCMGRLWGLLGLYFATKRLVAKSFSSSSSAVDEKKEPINAAEAQFDTLVAYTQIISLIIFQSAENVAYLSSRKVLPFSPATQGKLGLLSVRSWAVYVGIEFGRLIIERSRKLSSGAAAKDINWSSEWKKTFLRNASWAPLTLHWGSTTGGFLPDVLVSFFGAYPATSQVLDLWKANAA